MAARGDEPARSQNAIFSAQKDSCQCRFAISVRCAGANSSSVASTENELLTGVVSELQRECLLSEFCVFSCFHSIETVHDCMCEFLCPFRNTGRAVAEKVARVLRPCVAIPAGLFYAGVQGPLPAPRLPGTSVCKTSLDFSSMRGDPGWLFFKAFFHELAIKQVTACLTFVLRGSKFACP